MSRLNLAQFGFLDPALLDGERASGMIPATRRRGGRRGQLGNGDGGGSLPVASYSSTGSLHPEEPAPAERARIG